MKYFTFEELSKTSTGIPNVPTEEHKRNLRLLVEKVLDPLRAMYGRPIYVNSGYRSPEVNKKVGGAAKSMHLKGCAADITTKDKTYNIMLYYLLMWMASFDGMNVTKVINEKGGKWIHVEYMEGNTPNKFLELP